MPMKKKPGPAETIFFFLLLFISAYANRSSLGNESRCLFAARVSNRVYEALRHGVCRVDLHLSCRGRSSRRGNLELRRTCMSAAGRGLGCILGARADRHILWGSSRYAPARGAHCNTITPALLNHTTGLVARTGTRVSVHNYSVRLLLPTAGTATAERERAQPGEHAERLAGSRTHARRAPACFPLSSASSSSFSFSCGVEACLFLRAGGTHRTPSLFYFEGPLFGGVDKNFGTRKIYHHAYPCKFSFRSLELE